MIELTQEEIRDALQTTYTMLKSPDVSTPNSWNSNLADMEQIIMGVLQGQLKIAPAQGPAIDPGAPPGDSPELGGGVET